MPGEVRRPQGGGEGSPPSSRDLREEEEVFASASGMDHAVILGPVSVATPSGRRRRAPPISETQGGGGASGI
jgi:hypothetical protein